MRNPRLVRTKSVRDAFFWGYKGIATNLNNAAVCAMLNCLKRTKLSSCIHGGTLGILAQPDAPRFVLKLVSAQIRPIDWDPLGGVGEDSPHTCKLLCIRGEAVVDPSRHDQQVSLFATYSQPPVIRASNVKEPTPVQKESDLFVVMQMFFKENLHFLLITWN